jgi:hypothetical protein
MAHAKRNPVRVVVTPAGAALEHGDDFTSFDFTSELGLVQVGFAMTDLGLGVADADGRHAWFVVDEIIRIAGPSADEQWRRRFGGMVDYALKRGWVDGAGRVRAHRAIAA